MASKTFTVMVSQGLTEAGVASSQLAAVKEMVKDWLRSTYAGFLWPFLRREKLAIALGSGVSYLEFGMGSGSITEEIQRINDPIKIYDSEYRTRENIRITTDWSNDLDSDSDLIDPTSNTGLPTKARVVPDATLRGKWKVVFNYVADRAYLLKMSYHVIPNAPADGDYPIYPNDATIVQAANCAALKHMKRMDEYREDLKILVSKVREDRVKYCEAPGINDMIGNFGLDSRTFK